ncbi:hypothetical protein F4680DRAFT_438095 [Xylaria scruposa]|nr:hypothetical protein F4680DRAFT_438095 [Xylaria scruposa]
MPSPVDPRRLLPSRAEPQERKRRKELEKEAAVGLTEVAVLGLIGLTLAWDIDKQVHKKEEQKEKEEAEQRKREERERRRREKAFHDGTFDPRRNYMVSSDGGSRRSERDDRSASGSYARDPRRRQSVDYRADPRYDDRYRDRTPRYDPRAYHRYDRPYEEMRDYDLAERGRSRRDSF